MKYVRFYGSNGYVGCDYEYYECFSDDENEDRISDISIEYAYENAESYFYTVCKHKEDLIEEEEAEYDEEAEYYAGALEYSGWEYITEEEYKENNEEF